jgi:hypothetical protein
VLRPANLLEVVVDRATAWQLPRMRIDHPAERFQQGIGVELATPGADLYDNISNGRWIDITASQRVYPLPLTETLASIQQKTRAFLNRRITALVLVAQTLGLAETLIKRPQALNEAVKYDNDHRSMQELDAKGTVSGRDQFDGDRQWNVDYQALSPSEQQAIDKLTGRDWEVLISAYDIASTIFFGRD